MGYTDQQNDAFLGSRKILPAENIDQRNHSADNTDINPPDHPTAHLQVDKHKPLLNGIRCDIGTLGGSHRIQGQAGISGGFT
jgi:hypothetical protein